MTNQAEQLAIYAQAIMKRDSTIATLTAERDEAIGNAQHAIHQAEALAARVATLEAACRVIATAEMFDPTTRITDADVLEAVQEAARAALTPRDGGGTP